MVEEMDRCEEILDLRESASDKSDLHPQHAADLQLSASQGEAI